MWQPCYYCYSNLDSLQLWVVANGVEELEVEEQEFELNQAINKIILMWWNLEVKMRKTQMQKHDFD